MADCFDIQSPGSSLCDRFLRFLPVDCVVRGSRSVGPWGLLRLVTVDRSAQRIWLAGLDFFGAESLCALQLASTRFTTSVGRPVCAVVNASSSAGKKRCLLSPGPISDGGTVSRLQIATWTVTQQIFSDSFLATFQRLARPILLRFSA